MRKELRNCDMCEEKIYQDTGAWIGGHLILTDTWVGYSVVQLEKQMDLCPSCLDKIKKLIGWEVRK